MARGENCTLTVEGYGSRRARCIRIVHGISIVSTQDYSKHGAAFYATKRTSSSFGMTLIFTDHAQYQDMATWLSDYGKAVTDHVVLKPMQVSVPSRRFLKVGIPESPIPFGRSQPDFVWRMGLDFVGTRDSLAFDNPAVSQFKMAELGVVAVVPYYLPATTPTDGKTGEKQLYDQPPRPLRGAY